MWGSLRSAAQGGRATDGGDNTTRSHALANVSTASVTTPNLRSGIDCFSALGPGSRLVVLEALPLWGMLYIFIVAPRETAL